MPDINQQGSEGGAAQGATDEGGAGPQAPEPIVLEGIVVKHGILRTRPRVKHTASI